MLSLRRNYKFVLLTPKEVSIQRKVVSEYKYHFKMVNMGFGNASEHLIKHCSLRKVALVSEYLLIGDILSPQVLR